MNASSLTVRAVSDTAVSYNDVIMIDIDASRGTPLFANLPDGRDGSPKRGARRAVADGLLWGYAPDEAYW